MYNSKTDQIVAPLARYLQITINFNSAQPQGTVKFLKMYFWHENVHLSSN